MVAVVVKSFNVLRCQGKISGGGIVGATADYSSEAITVWSRLYALMEEMRLSQNCGENVRFHRSAMIFDSFRSTSSPRALIGQTVLSTHPQK